MNAPVSSKELPDGLTLAPCRPDDLAELLVLQRCCWVEVAVENDTLGIPALHETAADIAAWVAEWTVLCVRAGGRLVAAVRGQLLGDAWEIGRLMVAPDFVGRGIGRWLLAEIERRAPDDVTSFVLFTGPRSERNLRMYARAGYVRSDGADHDVDGYVSGAVILVKQASR